MQKQFSAKTADGTLTPEALEAINRCTQTPVTADEVFVFSVLLCDNEVDRDFERFSVESLHALAPLFLGKTAISNHSMDANDQTARTFFTEVLTDPVKKTSLGEAYTYLKAHCYMLRIPKNEALIAEISAGIKKEVSVGCAVSKRICSICGADKSKTPCAHQNGKTYRGKLCHTVLEAPTDAYEWSFVAVPAQRNAGVTNKGFLCSDAVLRALQNPQTASLTLQKDELTALREKLHALEQAAEDGKQYRAALCSQAVKSFTGLLPAVSAELAERLFSSLQTAELKALNAALDARQAAALLPPQLCGSIPEEKTKPLHAFKF